MPIATEICHKEIQINSSNDVCTKLYDKIFFTICKTKKYVHL